MIHSYCKLIGDECFTRYFLPLLPYVVVCFWDSFFYFFWRSLLMHLLSRHILHPNYCHIPARFLFSRSIPFPSWYTLSLFGIKFSILGSIFTSVLKNQGSSAHAKNHRWYNKQRDLCFIVIITGESICEWSKQNVMSVELSGRENRISLLCFCCKSMVSFTWNSEHIQFFHW